MFTQTELKYDSRDFSSAPAVEVSILQCRGYASIPERGSKIPQAASNLAHVLQLLNPQAGVCVPARVHSAITKDPAGCKGALCSAKI